MPISRRRFVRSSALAAAALGAPSVVRAQAPAKTGLGVQLYSVRDDCGRDFDKALEQIARMGFEGVEFAGYHNYAGKAQALRQRLDDLGLKGFSTHIGTGNLRGDELKKTIEFHKTLGCQFLIVPGDGDFTHPEKSKALAELFNEVAETLKPLGLACGYHNHTKEFEKDGGKTYFELFAERATKGVVLQQDCGWSAAAGQDPVGLMKRWPGRFRVQHFKPTVINNEAGKKAIIGEDSVAWPTVLQAARTVGGTEWVILEQEAYPDGKSPMECTQLSLAGLRKIW